MAEDYYNAADEADSSQAPDKAREDESSDNLQETALIPKSALGDKAVEVGKECKFKVVSIHDDEVEIEYVPHKDKEDKKEPEPDEAHASIDTGIAKMGVM